MLSPACAEPDAGHALAQKFAVGDESPPKAVKPQPKKIAETKPAKRAPAPGQDYEREMLEAAKAEAAQRQAAEKGNAASQPQATPAASPPEPTRVEGTQPTPAAPATRPPAADTPPEREGKVQANVPATDAAPREISGNRASILVILNQGGDDIPKTFDPIICLGDVCYVSEGIESDAKPLSRAEALSSKGSMTPGAGACADSAACAFRGVTIPEGQTLQIVDLGIVRHEEGEQVPAKIDPTCMVDDSYLACNKPATAPDYRIWIVPEAIAAKAGAEKIADALDDELPEENVSLDTDK